MKELEKKKTVLFKSDDPVKLMYLIRQGLHVEPWLHLAPIYAVKIRKIEGKKVGVWCLVKEESHQLEIVKEEKIIPEDYTLLMLAQEIILGLESGIIHKYINLSIGENELKDLEVLCTNKGYIYRNLPTHIEIET